MPIVAVVVGTALLVGYLVTVVVEGRMIDAGSDRIREHSFYLAGRFSDYLGESYSDIQSIHSSPGIESYVRARSAGGPDPITGLTTEQLDGMVSQMLLSFIRHHRPILQIRVIGLADDGLELIRVERQSHTGTLRVVRGDALQRKGARSYFREIMKIPAGRVYVSPIELNREYGAIEQPDVPVIRFGMALLTPEGRVFGALVVNYDLRPIFDELRDSAAPAQSVYAINSDGDFLLHPQPERTFGFERGGGPNRIGDLLPSFADIFDEEDAAASLSVTSTDTPVVVATAPVIVESVQLARIVKVEPVASLLAPMADMRILSLVVAAIAGLVAACVAALVSFSIARPIRQTARAVLALGSVGEPELPAGGCREVRTLTNAVRRFSAQAHEVRAQFLANMSHELRTPLTAVVGFSELMKLEVAGAIEPKSYRTYVDNIYRSGRDLLVLIDNLLDLSRVEAQRFHVTPVRVVLAEIVRTQVSGMRDLAHAKGATFALSLDTEALAVNTDQYVLSKAVRNVLLHAVNSTKASGKVTVSLRHGPLGSVDLVVSDSEHVMTQEQVVGAFGSFVNVEDAYNAAISRGTGVELVLASRLLELLGATIDLSSREGTGTIVSIRFPFELVAAAA